MLGLLDGYAPDPDAAPPAAQAVIEPVYNHAGCRLFRGDSRQLASEPLGKVHAVVTDPPYERGLDNLKWDRSGVAFDARFWRRVLLQLVPGGWAIVFGAPRFLGRLHLALEDGGFSVEDTGAWIYGSGWPKGRTRLKPAWEPWVLCRRPGPSRELNVDQAGIGDSRSLGRSRACCTRRRWQSLPVMPGRESRYPTNLIIDPEVAAEVDRQSGHSKGQRHIQNHGPRPNDLYLENRKLPNVAGYDDEGGASRFYYVAKPSRAEKDMANRHVSVEPVELKTHLVELVSFSSETVWDPFLGSGTTGVACLKLGRRFIGMELDQRSLDTAIRRLRRASIRGGHDGDELDAGAPGGGAPESLELPPAG